VNALVEHAPWPGQLVAEPDDPRLGRLAPQPETLGRAAQPVERLQRLLASPRRVAQLLLRLHAIGEQQL
jgi:hypothetical protein